jgi:hypothetical protein
MTTTTVKTNLTNASVESAIEKSNGVLNSILNTLDILGKAWEESRAEYKKHAVLGGGWE